MAEQTRLKDVNAALAKIDAAITGLQEEKAPLLAERNRLTDTSADFEVTLDDGNGQLTVVVQHGETKDDAARKAMARHPGLTAQHSKTKVAEAAAPVVAEAAPVVVVPPEVAPSDPLVPSTLGPGE